MMVAQGLLLLVAGIGTVFLFLSIMVAVMLAVGLYFKANESRYMEQESPQKTTVPHSVDMQSIVAAIAVSLP
ncbi:MAG: OadG family transporter subunit [Kiritimatiellia bacterium]